MFGRCDRGNYKYKLVAKDINVFINTMCHFWYMDFCIIVVYKINRVGWHNLSR